MRKTGAMGDAEKEAGRRRQVAVALRGDGVAGARVVASGRGALAGIKVREDADLAETLAALEIDADMPVDALAAVAEILARLYALNGAPQPTEPQ